MADLIILKAFSKHQYQSRINRIKYKWPNRFRTIVCTIMTDLMIRCRTSKKILVLWKCITNRSICLQMNGIYWLKLKRNAPNVKYFSAKSLVAWQRCVRLPQLVTVSAGRVGHSSNIHIYVYFVNGALWVSSAPAAKSRNSRQTASAMRWRWISSS